MSTRCEDEWEGRRSRGPQQAAATHSGPTESNEPQWGVCVCARFIVPPSPAASSEASGRKMDCTHVAKAHLCRHSTPNAIMKSLMCPDGVFRGSPTWKLLRDRFASSQLAFESIAAISWFPVILMLQSGFSRVLGISLASFYDSEHCYESCWEAL